MTVDPADLHSSTMSTAGTLVSPILVGRDDLLDLADRRLAEVRSGRGHLLFLAGEAGIGKTRLLTRDRPARRKPLGFAVAGGDVGIRDLEVAGSLIFDLTHSMTGREAFQPVRTAILKRMTEGRRTNTDAPGRGDASQRRRELVHDVADLLATVPAPALLCFENLHWADDLTPGDRRGVRPPRARRPDPRARDLPERRALSADPDARVAIEAPDPAAGGGGPSRAALGLARRG